MHLWRRRTGGSGVVARRPAEEQILAILRGNTLCWTVEQLPQGVSIDDVGFVDLVSVTRDEVDAWVAANGFGSTSVRDDRDDGAEGLHLLPDGDGWEVFYSERGHRSFTHRFATQAEARGWVVDHLFERARGAFSHRS